MKTSASLDLLRGCSAQIVLIGHLSSLVVDPRRPEEQSFLAGIAWKGVGFLSGHGLDAVVVFFVLSGFFVGGGLFAAMRAGRFAFGDYVLRRGTRLYTVIVPGLLLSGAIGWLSFTYGEGTAVISRNTPWYMPGWLESGSLSWSTLGCNLAFLQTIACIQYGNNSALWSLSNEAMYYLCFPSLLLLFFGSFGWKQIAAVLILSVYSLLIASLFAHGDLDRVQLFAVGFATWMAGAFLLPVLTTPRSSNRAVKVLAVVGGLLVAINLLLGGEVWIVRAATVAVASLAYIAYAPALDQIVFATRKHLEVAANWLSNYSFTLYVVHIPIIFLVLSFCRPLLEKVSKTASGFAIYWSMFVVINAVAYGLYWCFERHHPAIYRRLRSYGGARIPFLANGGK